MQEGNPTGALDPAAADRTGPRIPVQRCGIARWKCPTSANDVANADFTKRLEGTSFEARSILSSNLWTTTRTLQRRNGLMQTDETNFSPWFCFDGHWAVAGSSRSASKILATEGIDFRLASGLHRRVWKGDSHGMDCSGVSLDASFIALWSCWGTSPHIPSQRLPKQKPR